MEFTTNRLEPARPAWLLDTRRLCLVPGTANAPYVALSYVWGQLPFFKTLKNNLTELQTDQAFSGCRTRLGVPRTVADAISVVFWGCGISGSMPCASFKMMKRQDKISLII
jgi:hypothetical protein